jgi:acyl dehydratase
MTMARSLALSRDIVGVTVGPIVHDIDARRLMAYAAGLGETDARYYDTLASSGPAAHPLFPVCYEWPAMLALRERTTPEAIALRSVHATHDLTLHRPPRAGDTLSTTARVTGLAHGRAGTLMTVRQETVGADGLPVSTTDYGSVYRDVGFEGEDSGFRPEARGGLEMPAGAVELPVAVPAGLAHVYTECARIWNPIHTDLAVAHAAGLPGPILHGTATLALAVGRIVARDLDQEPGRVREVAARFTGMVSMPARLALRRRPPAGGRVPFEVTLADGRPVLDHGTVVT